MSHLKRNGTRRVPRWAQTPDPGRVPDRSAGCALAVDDWTRLRRFLVLGSEGGGYDASERTLTRENAGAVERCIRADGRRAVAEIVRVSDAGQAPDDEPALFGLAMAAGLGDPETRRAALEALPQVARTGTHLFRFATFVEDFRGWGRSLRRAVGAWYAAQPVEALAEQAVEHRRREGVAHRDLLRMAHPARRVSADNPTVAITREHERLFEWIVRGGSTDGLPRLVEGFARVQAAQTPAQAARLVAEYRLPREAIRDEHLAAPGV
jgi:60 kDa SS-A/Ro ribonucleoprotein